MIWVVRFGIGNPPVAHCWMILTSQMILNSLVDYIRSVFYVRCLILLSYKSPSWDTLQSVNNVFFNALKPSWLINKTSK